MLSRTCASVAEARAAGFIIQVCEPMGMRLKANRQMIERIMSDLANVDFCMVASETHQAIYRKPPLPTFTRSPIMPRMKVLLAIPLIAVLLCSCAQTTLYDRRTGRAIARFQGDMIGSHYVDGQTTWNVQQVSHSAATLAQGAAAANVITSVGTAAAGVALAAGNSGLFTRAAGVAIPAVLQVAQPRPAALQSH